MSVWWRMKLLWLWQRPYWLSTVSCNSSFVSKFTLFSISQTRLRTRPPRLVLIVAILLQLSIGSQAIMVDTSRRSIWAIGYQVKGMPSGRHYVYHHQRQQTHSHCTIFNQTPSMSFKCMHPIDLDPVCQQHQHVPQPKVFLSTNLHNRHDKPTLHLFLLFFSAWSFGEKIYPTDASGATYIPTVQKPSG